MIDMDTFIHNLQTSHKFSMDQTKNLLKMFRNCGLMSYGNCLSHVLKENCYQQMKDINSQRPVRSLPIVCTDSNLRSYKEKTNGMWKTQYNDQNISKSLQFKAR